MRISDLVRMGLRNLNRRRARTALTVIGIVIGTISITVMFSIGIGLNKSFEEQVMQMGSMTMITVNNYADTMNSKGDYTGSKEQKLDDKLVESIKQIPHVKNVSPVTDVNIELHSGRYMNSTNISVMDSSSFEDFGFPALNSGDYNPSDSKRRVKIWAGKDLFSYFYDPNSSNFQSKAIDPEKDRITVSLAQDENTPTDSNTGKVTVDFKKYTADVCTFNTDDYSEYSYSMYMDRSDFENMYKDYLSQLTGDAKKKAKKKLTVYSSIKVNADNVKNVEKIQEAITALGYQSSSLSSMTKQMQQTSNMIQAVLGGIGAVAMIVAAISIANTMVMSIYERTKEIGVMKVLGCQVSDIKKLFLFESGMMGLIGGVIGIALRYLASFIINRFGGQILSSMDGGGGASKLSIIPWWLPVASSLFALLVGVLSGYYPASRATKISAIEAMKSE